MRRISSTFLLVVGTALLAGCAYRAQFILVNDSGRPIIVTYQLKDTDELSPWPMLALSTVKQLEEHNSYDELPSDRYTVDTETLLYRTALNDQEVLFLTKIDLRDIDKEPVFKAGMSEITIKSDIGSISYTGDKVFREFVPSHSGIFPGSPMRYTLIYK